MLEFRLLRHALFRLLPALLLTLSLMTGQAAMAYGGKPEQAAQDRHHQEQRWSKWAALSPIDEDILRQAAVKGLESWSPDALLVPEIAALAVPELGRAIWWTLPWPSPGGRATVYQSRAPPLAPSLIV